jgi:F0F1-type ATP synthase assembly protein I
VSEPKRGGGGRPSSPLDFASLGFETVAPVVLFLFAGYLLDGWVDSQPWFLLGGALLGIVVGMYNLFRRVLPPKGGGPIK